MSKPASHRSGNPAKRAAAARAPRKPSPGGRSRALLTWLAHQPKWLVPVLTVVMSMGGMFLPPVPGGLCLLAVALFLGWLAWLAWSTLSTAGRIVRVLIIGVVVGIALGRIAGIWVA